MYFNTMTNVDCKNLDSCIDKNDNILKYGRGDPFTNWQNYYLKIFSISKLIYVASSDHVTSCDMTKILNIIPIFLWSNCPSKIKQRVPRQ